MFQEKEMIIRFVIAIVVVVCALIDDCRHYRISNTIIIAGVLIGVLFLAMDIVLGRKWNVYLAGAGVGFVIMMLIYLIGGVGAGDVKLFGVLGLFLGFSSIIIIAFVSMFTGAVIGMFGICISTCKVKTIKMAGNISVRVHSFHYTIAIVIGVLFVLVSNWGGVMSA